MDHAERWQHIQHLSHNNANNNLVRQTSPVASPCNLPIELVAEEQFTDLDEEFNMLPSENWQDTLASAIQSPLAALRKRSGATGTFRQQQGPPAEQPLFHTRQNSFQSLAKQRVTGSMNCSEDEDDLASLLRTQGITPSTSHGQHIHAHRMSQAWGGETYVSFPTPACRTACLTLREWAFNCHALWMIC